MTVAGTSGIGRNFRRYTVLTLMNIEKVALFPISSVCLEVKSLMLVYLQHLFNPQVSKERDLRPRAFHRQLYLAKRKSFKVVFNFMVTLILR